MHSCEYLLKEVEEKLVNVQKALCICETEKSLLNKNLISSKQAVGDSFKRHIGTLQCRAKWLVCHADSIFHLKEGSLSQQVAELEIISNELKSCLDASDCSFNRSEEIKMMATNVLQNAANVSLQACESGTMSFVAHDDKMEETIIGFGDIDVNSAYDHSNEYDLLSDEGIFVVENCLKKQDSIEMEVKSIEMHHLTAQSANSEKEDFERIDIELQPITAYVNSEGPAILSQLSQGDSAYEEETDSSKSVEWLHRANIISNQVVPEKTSNDVNLSDDIKSEKKTEDVSNRTDKVPLWLKKCEETNPWIRHSRSNSITDKTTPKVVEPAEGSSILLLKDHQLIDNDCCFKSQKRNSSQARLSFNEKEESSNISYMDGIALASNSKFLRIDIEKMNNSVYSLDSALNSMILLENQPKQLSDSQSKFSRSTINIDHFNGIFEAPSSNFLRDDTSNMNNSNSVYLLDSDLNSMVLLNKEPNVISDSLSEFSMDRSVYTPKSNIEHISRILDTPQSEFLVAQDMSSDHQVLMETYIKPTNAVNYMRIIEKQPDKMFLRSGGKTKMFDPAMCEWLRGSSTDSCAQCFDFNDCGINRKFDGKWIKTATDW